MNWSKLMFLIQLQHTSVFPKYKTEGDIDKLGLVCSIDPSTLTMWLCMSLWEKTNTKLFLLWHSTMGIKVKFKNENLWEIQQHISYHRVNQHFINTALNHLVIVSVRDIPGYISYRWQNCPIRNYVAPSNVWSWRPDVMYVPSHICIYSIYT